MTNVCSFAWFVSSFGFIGTEKSHWGSGQLRFFFFFVVGSGEVESRTRSGSRLSLKALKRKFSLPEKGQDYSFVKTEVGYLIEKNCYIAGVSYTVSIHWLVHGHMTCSNETLYCQIPWVGNIAKTIMSNGKTVHCYPRNVDRRCTKFVDQVIICLQLGNSELCFPREILGKQNSLFPWEPVIKWFVT